MNETHFFEIVTVIMLALIAAQWFAAARKHDRWALGLTLVQIAFLWSIPAQFFYWGCGPCGQGALLIFPLVPIVIVLTIVPVLSRTLARRMFPGECKSDGTPTGA